MSLETMQILMYLVIGASMIFYTVLDGFDIGVGMLHLFVKTDHDRRIMLNSIGPVWDGNAVWLVIIGGALFAAFPDVYATLFSSFYNLVMVLLMGLIFRAVAIEIRSKGPSRRWRQTWDVIFSVASYTIAFGVGVALGNLVEGIPLTANKVYQGGFVDAFRAYPVLCGITSMALFSMHGAIYLLMKTEGETHERIRRMVTPAIAIFLVLYLLLTLVTLLQMPHMLETMLQRPYLFALPVLAFCSLILVPKLISHQQDGWAFVSSCAGICFLIAVFGIGTFPMMIRSSIDTAVNSLTLMNSASSALTLKVLLIVVVTGIPLVLTYGFYQYRVFRGKVKLGPGSY